MPIKLLTGVGLLLLASMTEVALAEGYSFGLGLGAGYIADAKISPTGKEDSSEYHYHGARAAFTVFRPYNRNGLNGSLGGYVEGISLQNNFTEPKDPEAQVNKGKSTTQLDQASHETMTAIGVGAEMVNNFFVNFQTIFGLGVYQTQFKQDGDTPKTQIYDFCAALKVGVGIGPRMGETGIAARAEFQYMGMQSGRELGSKQKLYNLNSQAFTPTVTFVLGF